MADGIAGLARVLAPVLASPDLPAAGRSSPALIIVLSGHQPGDTVRYSQIIPVQQALGISAGRAAEVLQEMGVLDDDRRPSFESWLDRKLDGLAPGIRADAEAWLRTLRDGGPAAGPGTSHRPGTT